MMMNALCEKVLSYMWENKKTTFVDMYAGDFMGLDTFPVMEGNGLKGKNGQKITFQYSTISRGTERDLQLRNYDVERNRWNVDECIKIGDMFPNREVIIITNGDALTGFAPVFDDKLDLALWLRDLQELAEKSESDLYPYSFADMRELAKFLYWNNPNKVKSIVDEL